MKGKRILSIKWFLPFFVLSVFTGGFTQNMLVSVKKGNRGDKSWAVFAFDKKAILIGVSQFDMGKLSLYLWGNSGSLDGSVITLDQAYDRSILIKQVHPSIIRADVLNAASGPMSILKKNGNVVIAYNDERLLDGSTLLYGEPVGVPGKMTGLIPSSENDRVTASIQFNGTFDWIGYVRSSPETAFLFIRGVELNTDQNGLTFNAGTLNSIKMTSMQGEISGIRSELSLTQNTALNIVRKSNEMVVQATISKTEFDTSITAPEAASAETEIPGTSRTASTASESQQTMPVSVESKPMEPTPKEQPAPQESGDTIPWDRLVSFEFRTTPIRDALQLVASTNNINMVITEGVKGSVTMKLENVTLRQALDKMINTQNCEYTIDASIITVKPVKTEYAGGRITKVYRLKYADAVNVAKVIRRIASSDSLVDVFHPEFLDFTESGKNRRDANSQLVQGIRRSSILVVTDRPEKIQEIDQVIRELDKPPAQIHIESKLVEMRPDYEKQIGIDWQQTFQMLYDNMPGTSKTLDILNTDPTGSGSVFQLTREWQTGHLTKNQYASILNFLQTKTDAKMILNPQITAMDNEESIISIGQTIPVASLQRGTGGQGDLVTFTYREVSIRLNVTPHVLGNGEVTMYINPVIEEISEWKTMLGAEAPITDKRSVNSIVTVKNGETVVIGGLIKNFRKKVTKKVWLLGNLPLFGRLFQYEDMKDTQTELMIFITPNVVES